MGKTAIHVKPARAKKILTEMSGLCLKVTKKPAKTSNNIALLTLSNSRLFFDEKIINPNRKNSALISIGIVEIISVSGCEKNKDQN